MRDPAIKKKCIREVEKYFGKGLNADEMAHHLGGVDLEYVDTCFMEAMRIDPPFPLSTMHIAMDNIEIKSLDDEGNKKKLQVPKGTQFQLNIAAIQNDPEQWSNPDKYEPDRFDPKSQHFKNAAGEERNPMCWCPFSAGQRTCPGDMFSRMS